jgi:hypothetical protein
MVLENENSLNILKVDSITRIIKRQSVTWFTQTYQTDYYQLVEFTRLLTELFVIALDNQSLDFIRDKVAFETSPFPTLHHIWSCCN